MDRQTAELKDRQTDINIDRQTAGLSMFYASVGSASTTDVKPKPLNLRDL